MSAFVDVAKANVAMRRTRNLRATNDLVARRASTMARGIEGALRRYAFRELRRIRADTFHPFVKAAIAKASSEDDLRRELLALMVKFGVYQLDSAASRSSAGRWIMPPRILDDVVREKQIKVVLLVNRTRDATRESLRQILDEALSESPRPSPQEVGRRIARSWFGPDLKTSVGRETATENRLTARWQRREEGGVRPGEQEYLFSFDRAATIARTELAQAENAGIAAGLTAIGIERVRWLAHPDDGRSSTREHWRMNDHEPITIAAMNGSDPSGWFELPSGICAPYPGWMGLPAGETVNCRCVLTGA